MPCRPLPSSRTSTLKNAVMSATRAACCMLCVTITIVYSRLSSWIRSSMRAVEIGSSAERGLVHQDHVGLDGDRAGDAEPLLLAAGEAERVVLESVLDLVPERRAAQRALDALVEALLHPEHAWGRRRCSRRSTSGTGSASGTPSRSGGAPRPGRRPRRRGRGRGSRRCPRRAAPGMRSFMRLKQRMNVLLPQPEGPMNAVT